MLVDLQISAIAIQYRVQQQAHVAYDMLSPDLSVMLYSPVRRLLCCKQRTFIL
jgi:hypothetical protein